MAWYALIDNANGALVSIASELPSPLPAGTVSMDLGNIPPDQSKVLWNPASRTWTNRPARVVFDRLNDILTDPAFSDFQSVYNALTAQRRTNLINALDRMLGNMRWRFEGEPVPVAPAGPLSLE